YQWGPMAGFIWTLPHVWRGVTLDPYVRYLSGFDPQYANVTEVRKLELFPAATFGLGGGWSLYLYPDNPITYNHANRTWFVPIDLLVAYRVNRQFEIGFGGAKRIGHSSDPSFSYIIDTRAVIHF